MPRKLWRIAVFMYFLWVLTLGAEGGQNPPTNKPIIPTPPARSVSSEGDPVWVLHIPWFQPFPGPERLAFPIIINAEVLTKEPGPASVAAQTDGAELQAATPKPPAPKSFVQAEGDRLVLDGKPYHFLGVNVMSLTLTYFPEREIEPILKYLAETEGVNAIRFWITPKEDPEMEEYLLDRLEYILDLGAQYNLHFVVGLQNYHYYKTQSWFATRYIEEDLPHVRAFVSRFRDRPEILMWELMNEPGCGPENGSKECCDHVYRWAQDVSSEIKALDPHHLVSVGTTLRDGTKWEQANYDRLHALPTVDVVSIHRRVGKTSRGEMRVAEALNKPVFVGETYYRAYDDACRPTSGKILGERARYIGTDLEWSFSHGLDGYLLWQHEPGRVEMEDGDHQWFCGATSYFDGDPVYDVFKEYLAKFRAGEVVASTKVDSD